MSHITKDKGDLGAIMAMADLTEKGYSILSPVVTEHLPFDFIAYKDGVSTRIQAKYSSDGMIACSTNWNDKHGSHKQYYEDNDFDYYALYLPNIKKVVYPHITFGGCTIRSTLPNAPTPFYWYEDFLDLTKQAEKKNYKDFGIKLQANITDKVINRFIASRKVTRPSKEELEKLLWDKSTLQLANEFGVSDTTIGNWAKSYGIAKPPRGYWSGKK